VLVVASGVGRVGRDRDAAGGHDSEIGDQPFGPVLADQHHPVAAVEADPPQAGGKGDHLPPGVGPAHRPPVVAALRPQERLVAFLPGARQEHLDEILERFELSRHHSSPTGLVAQRAGSASVDEFGRFR
jgi:hypothetical protein